MILHFDQLPKIYKDYPTIDQIKDPYYQIVEIESDYSERVLQINDSTIVIAAAQRKDREDGSRDVKNAWFKINGRGQIKDSLTYEYNDRKEDHFYQTYHEYIVDIKNNTYTTWMTDGDATAKNFKNLNETKVFTAKEAENIAREKEVMYSERISSESDEQEAKYKVTIYKDKVWNYFYTDKDWKNSATYPVNNLEIQYTSSSDEIDKKPGLIKRLFVKKEEWIGSSFWHIDFGWGGGPRGDRWDGTGYFEITMPKKKLHFQQPVEIDYPDQSLRDRYTYKIYQPKNGDYLLLNNVESARYYLIRPKIIQ